MATVGSEAMYLVGTNMGPVGTGGSDVVVTYGSAGNPQYTATGCAVDVAHTRMRCVSVAGVGASHVWTVSVGGVAGVTSSGSSGMTSYTPPSVSSFPGLSVLRTEGGETVALAGSNFGPLSSVVRVVYRNSVYGVEYLASSGRGRQPRCRTGLPR